MAMPKTRQVDIVYDHFVIHCGLSHDESSIPANITAIRRPAHQIAKATWRVAVNRKSFISPGRHQVERTDSLHPPGRCDYGSG